MIYSHKMLSPTTGFFLACRKARAEWKATSDTQPHRKRVLQKEEPDLCAFIPLAFSSLTLSSGAAINTSGKEAQATSGFSKPDRAWT